MTIGLDAQLEPNNETMPCEFFPCNFFCLEVHKEKIDIFFYSFAPISYWCLGLFTSILMVNYWANYILPVTFG